LFVESVIRAVLWCVVADIAQKWQRSKHRTDFDPFVVPATITMLAQRYPARFQAVTPTAFGKAWKGLIGVARQ
jgi:hypothetical protein